MALRRAVHQLADHPPVFEDPLAVRIVGADAASKFLDAGLKDENIGSVSLRAFLAVRSRYAEDRLAEAVRDGVTQYLILGAGLDTFAYRNPYREALRVFEVDHPATQAWKIGLLAEAGIEIPSQAVLVPVDFERQRLDEALEAAHFRADRPAFCSWLGVVPYLTAQAFERTIQFLGSLPPSSGVVFDYAVPRDLLNGPEKRAFDALAARVAAIGESFQLFFAPSELESLLRAKGFRQMEDLSAAEINARYFRARSDDLNVKGRAGHLICARI